jgi:hypothetical protein
VKNHCELVGSEVLTAVTMKKTISWDILPSPAEFRHYFRGLYCFNPEANYIPARSWQLPGFLSNLEVFTKPVSTHRAGIVPSDIAKGRPNPTTGIPAHCLVEHMTVLNVILVSPNNHEAQPQPTSQNLHSSFGSEFWLLPSCPIPSRICLLACF